MSQPAPLTPAMLDAIARNPNVTAAIERLAICYAENQHRGQHTRAMRTAEQHLEESVGKAVWICVQDLTSGPTGNPKPSPAVAQARPVAITSAEYAAHAPPAWALQDDRSMFAMAGIDWIAPHDIDPEPRCEGLAFDPHDVCSRVGVWCAENTPWLSPVGWEGAGGECGGGA